MVVILSFSQKCHYIKNEVGVINTTKSPISMPASPSAFAKILAILFLLALRLYHPPYSKFKCHEVASTNERY